MILARNSITLSSVVDVQATYRYYILQSSTLTRPSKPTTNPPPSAWKDAEPSYTSGSTNSLYFVDLTVFSDGTWAYSEVSLSSSYEAAKEAYNKAAAAATSAATVQENLDNLEIGGTNLLLDSNAPSFAAVAGTTTRYLSDSGQSSSVTGEFVEITDPPVTGISYGYRLTCSTANASGTQRGYAWRAGTQEPKIKIKAGETYTLSCYVRKISGNPYYNQRYAYIPSGGSTTYVATDFAELTDTNWTQISYTFTYPSTTTTRGALYPIQLQCTSVGVLEACGFKFEKGNRATDWSPNPEDVNVVIDEMSDWVEGSGSPLYSMVTKWTDDAVSDTTKINGGWLQTNTVTAQHLAIGSFDNLVTVDENIPNSGVSDVNGLVSIISDSDGAIIKKSATSSYMQLNPRRANIFSLGDTIYYKFTVRRATAGTIRIGIWGYNDLAAGASSVVSFRTANLSVGTEDQTFSGVLELAQTNANAVTLVSAKYYTIMIQDTTSTKAQVYVTNATVYKQASSVMISDGAITAAKIDVEDLFAQNITATDLHITGTSTFEGDIIAKSLQLGTSGFNTFEFMDDNFGNEGGGHIIIHTETLHNEESGLYLGSSSQTIEMKHEGSQHLGILDLACGNPENPNHKGAGITLRSGLGKINGDVFFSWEDPDTLIQYEESMSASQIYKAVNNVNSIKNTLGTCTNLTGTYKTASWAEGTCTNCTFTASESGQYIVWLRYALQSNTATNRQMYMQYSFHGTASMPIRVVDYKEADTSGWVYHTVSIPAYATAGQTIYPYIHTGTAGIMFDIVMVVMRIS